MPDGQAYEQSCESERMEAQALYDRLTDPFPSRDIRKLQEDFREVFQALPEDNDLGLDFEIYSTNIAGSLSYVLNRKNIPPSQIACLPYSFFELYGKYKFLESRTRGLSGFGQGIPQL